MDWLGLFGVLMIGFAGGALFGNWVRAEVPLIKPGHILRLQVAPGHTELIIITEVTVDLSGSKPKVSGTFRDQREVKQQ